MHSSPPLSFIPLFLPSACFGACVLSLFSPVWLFETLRTARLLVHGILQARILEWVAMPSSRGSSPPRDEPASLVSPALAGGFFTMSTTKEAHLNFSNWKNSILSFYKFISSWFVDSKSTANMSRSTGLFGTRPYQCVNISRNLQYFSLLRWHVYPSRIVCEIVISVWDIKLRSCFHITKIQLRFLLDFSFFYVIIYLTCLFLT